MIGGEGDNQVVSPHLLHQKREEPLQQPVGTDGDVHHLMAVRPVTVAHQIVGGEPDCQQVGVRVSTQVLGPDHLHREIDQHLVLERGGLEPLHESFARGAGCELMGKGPAHPYDVFLRRHIVLAGEGVSGRGRMWSQVRPWYLLMAPLLLNRLT